MSSSRTIRTQAPGNTMLMGEHAILHGHPALACAVNQYMRVSLTPLNDDTIHIQSALKDYECSRLQPLRMDDAPELSFVLACIQSLQHELPSGFELMIKSDFSHTIGLGSSAAVIAATLKALLIFCDLSHSSEVIFDRGLAVIHKVQGRGSGTDLAASVLGGVIAYSVTPKRLERLGDLDDAALPQLALIYSGYKTTTPEVLRIVAAKEQAYPEVYTQIYQTMRRACTDAERCVREQHWGQLGELMNIYQGQMDALGVNDATLSNIVYTLRESDEVLGAKISGSGLGDCVLALGASANTLDSLPYQTILFSPSPTGVIVHDD